MKLKNKNTKNETYLTRIIACLCAAIIVWGGHPLFAANTYDAQINATQSEVSTYQKQQVRLEKFAATLEVAVRELNTQLADVNKQIVLNEQEYVRLTNELLYAESDVAAKSDELGAILRQVYFDSQVSPIEMVASSKSMSDYMDYYEGRDRLQSQMLKNLEVIKDAKRKLVNQQEEVNAVLRDGKAMRDTLAAKRDEQKELLTRTRGQQAAYTRLIAERNVGIAKQRAEQLGANQAYFSSGEVIPGDPNKGGYPSKWANAAQDSLVDNWGMYNRECVSYTAWKVHQKTGKMPYWGGRGNANQWPSSAEADGIKTGGTPKKGAVAIAFIGPYGHAMYVEEILKNDKIRVSEFNYYVNGTYTERITNGSGMTYIYFEK